MNLLKLTRHSEWFEPKIIPLLGVGYLTIYLNNYSISSAIPRLIFLIFSIAIGAIYVSVINDLSDIKIDAAAGKHNSMRDMANWQIVLILAVCFSLGIFCGYFIYPDTLSLFFFIMAWVIFSLYSLYPFRLKNRGIWGVFCDAMGAHLFPTLLIVCNLPYVTGHHPDLVWTIITAVWAFSYGLRGILWHQFRDRDNDILTHINTFASKVNPNNFKLPETLIFAVEIMSFAFMLHTIINVWLLIAVVLYILLIWTRRIGFNIATIIILTPKNQDFRILMHDFYLVFFPLLMLLNIAIAQQYGWILLICHVFLFPRPVYRVAKHFTLFTIKSIKSN